MKLPIALRNAMETGTCTLFMGAGIGHYVRRPDGSPAPTGSGLAKEIAEHFSIDAGANPNLATVAQVAEARTSRAELDLFISGALSDLEPDESLIWLFSRTWRAIYTTNYDRVIQRCYERISRPTQSPVTITTSRELVAYDPRFQVPVFHLHGSLFDGESKSALITSRDYARFRERRSMLFETLKISYATAPILYIGYANADPNWQTLMEEVRSEFEPSLPPESFRIAPIDDPIDAEALQSLGVTSLDGKLDAFVEVCSTELSNERVEPASLTLIQRSVPPALQAHFNGSPEAVARLLNSWTYLNQEDLAGHSNLTEYLKGDRPNWATIAQEAPFERDLESLIFDELLDFATAPVASARTYSVLGSAGYGITTILMAVAVRLVRERLGTILWHKVGSPFSQGDIEYAARNLEGPLILVVDNASDVAEALPATLASLRAGGRNVAFVLGDRTNEWKSRHFRLTPKEFIVEALSEGEIGRLIDCLGTHHSLGVLAHLPRDLQLAAVREKHGKELLVAMKEATEGQLFAAIIEDEYRSLGNALAQRVYGFVAAFHRGGALARDGLVASALDVNIADVFSELSETLEGVVLSDTIDEARGLTALRARHRVIANMVWERCLRPEDRGSFLLSAIRHLNLNYPADSRAFDNFVRSDDAVDSIATVEKRVEFFEQACRKDPRSPYVRQHYARMLRRARLFDDALDQVRIGLEIDEHARILYHTQGMILADMMASAQSTDVARRRLVQSEAAFRKVLEMNRRDEYGYQGLANLYLDWAKRSTGEAERVEYLRKCEETVSEGVKVVRDRESLWVVSSRVAEFLGDSPRAITALERAVGESPEGIFARYLLAREYLRSDRYSDVVKILGPVLEAHTDEYRSSLVYASALHRDGRPLGDSIAVLRLSEGAGGRDPRFLATLGGMLFVTEEFGEATRVFQRADDAGLSGPEAKRVQFQPLEKGVSLRRVGLMQSDGPGFTFIRVAGWPDVFCSAAECRNVSMERGKRVEFTLGFNAKGPVALEVLEP